MVTINYTIKGSIKVDNQVYAEAATEQDQDFNAMTEGEKADFVKEIEADNGNEACYEHASDGSGNLEITSIEVS